MNIYYKDQGNLSKSVVLINSIEDSHIEISTKKETQILKMNPRLRLFYRNHKDCRHGPPYLPIINFNKENTIGTVDGNQQLPYSSFIKFKNNIQIKLNLMLSYIATLKPILMKTFNRKIKITLASFLLVFSNVFLSPVLAQNLDLNETHDEINFNNNNDIDSDGFIISANTNISDLGNNEVDLSSDFISEANSNNNSFEEDFTIEDIRAEHINEHRNYPEKKFNVVEGKMIMAEISCPLITTDMDVPVMKCPELTNVNIGDLLTVTTCTEPAAVNGEVLVNVDNCITYTPNVGFTGQDSFCLVVCDQFDICDTTVVQVNVTPTPIILGDFSVCSEELSIYTLANYNPLNTYFWNVSGNGTITNIINGEVTIQWNDDEGSNNQISVNEDAGNSISGIAFANVVIEEDLPLSCNGGVNISLPEDCDAIVTADMILEGSNYPEDSYTVKIIDDEGNELPSNLIDASYIGQTLEVQVIHDCTGNYCWGYITIEDKIAPVIICPENDTITCDEYANYVITNPALVNNGCGDETIETTSLETVGECDDEFAFTLIITQVAVDQSGNESDPCTYSIFVEKESIDDLDLPVNYDGLAGNEDAISCSSGYATDENGHPATSVTGEPGGLGFCASITFTYVDDILPICDSDCDNTESSYKVLRNWYIVEWCTSTIIEHTQIIKVMDFEAPVIAPINDITVSTDVWGCGATIDLPIPAAIDNCSDAESIAFTFSSTEGTQVGNTFVLADPAVTALGEPIEITVSAEDCCGNTSETVFNVTVEDNIPPVVIGETTHNVSLTLNGVAKIFAEDFDDGSHDGCGPIGFFVKRMDNGSGCQSFDEFPPSGNDNAQFNEAVFFCCNDIGTQPVMVQFQVCDDGNGDGIIGNNGDNCNFAMVEVFVQDKLAPAILCPEDMTITCTEVAGLDLTDMNLLDEMFGTATAAGTCNVSMTNTATGTEVCGSGTIFRNFTATNTGGSATCTQIITVEAGPLGLLACDRIAFADLSNSVYNWCAVNDNINDNDDDLPALEINCGDELAIPELDLNIVGLCTEAGVQISVDTFNFAAGACKKYVVHYEVIDQCIFDENFVNPTTGQIDPYHSGNGYFEFYLEINATDNEAPILDCTTIELVATTCDGYTDGITVTGTDNCTDPSEFTKQWRLDVNNDGIFDFPSSGFVNSNEVSASQIGLSGIPAGTHSIVWIVNDGCGNEATCSQLITIIGEDKAPTPYCYNGLSVAVMPSSGSVDLWANDFNAGSFDNCNGPLEFSMIPEIDVIGLTAEEAYSLSTTHANVTQQANGDFGFTFDCSYIPNGISIVLEIRVFVTDENGNWDYCTATLRLDDNFDSCEDSGTLGELTIEGITKTFQDEPIELVDFKFDANFPEFPMSQMTQSDGLYSFNNVANYVDYILTPSRNDNHLNGVTTLDIVLIQKHILAISTIENPYQLIAADVNSDCQVNGLDLVQLRKLILGKYDNDILPDNKSWRFVSDDQELGHDQQPCTYLENADLPNLETSVTKDFTGVKIGDINGSVNANLLGEADIRSGEELKFIVNNMGIINGETYDIEFLAKDFNEVYGYQFTLEFNGLQVVGTKTGALELTDANFGLNQLTNGVITTSYDNHRGLSIADDAVLFTITVKASTSDDLANLLAFTSAKTKAEAYVSENLEIHTPLIEFRMGDTQIADSYSFELFQNEPNPFKEQTNIAFDMPKTAEATLTIFDVSGKLLYMKIDTYAKGENSISVSSKDINANGVMYYKLETADFNATKKMIIIE